MAVSAQHLTPHQLLRAAECWNTLYGFASQNEDLVMQVQGYFCLCVALEMALKAYIVLKLPQYADPQRMKGKLSHNFDEMLKVIKQIDPERLGPELQSRLKQYNLLGADINAIKYPISPRVLSFDKNALNGNNDFTIIFQTIESAVKAGSAAWLEAYALHVNSVVEDA